MVDDEAMNPWLVFGLGVVCGAVSTYVVTGVVMLLVYGVRPGRT